MNILFALYYNLSCNSASHVDGVARQLAARGHECVVAVPDMDAGAMRFGETPYRVMLFDEAVRRLQAGTCFREHAARGADVLHCWTPREKLRKFVERLGRSRGGRGEGKRDFATVIHLEDNEWQIARAFLGEPGFALAQRGKLPGDFPDSLTDPVAGERFMERADGLTLLIDSLGQLMPAGKKSAVFWPAVDTGIFYPRERARCDAVRAELGIAPGTAVFVYSGNMHAANFREVRSLYLAVHLLNRQGLPARLIRLGKDNLDLPYGYEDWAATYTHAMGFIEDRRRIADLLSAADVLIQPGRPDPFNDLRFPSKLPEFFAMGKPVVLPRTNIGLVTRHLEDAYVLEDANGPNIARAVTEILGTDGLREKLSKGALDFYRRHCSWEKAAETLEKFYGELLGNRGAVG